MFASYRPILSLLRGTAFLLAASGLHGLLLYGGDAMLDMDDAPKLHDVWELVLPPVESHSSSRGVQ